MTYTNHMALRLRDVSLVSHVGPRMKEKLAARGFRKVWDLSSAAPERLEGIPGLGRATAEKLIVNARAIQKREIIPLDRSALHFRDCPRELYLDLEGTDPSGEGESLEPVDYLIGLLVSEAGNVQYRPFMAWRVDEEKQMFREFVAFVTSLGDTVIYHWHNYERWHLKQLGDRHGLTDVVQYEIFPRMVDLHRVATRAFAFPTPANGLKDIAKYLGFRWRHDDVNALDAIAWYLRFQKDPDIWLENLRTVVDYNEDDCMATKFVKDWLVSRSVAENRNAEVRVLVGAGPRSFSLCRVLPVWYITCSFDGDSLCVTGWHGIDSSDSRLSRSVAGVRYAWKDRLAGFSSSRWSWPSGFF